MAVGGKWSGVRLLMGLACALVTGIAAADGAPRGAFAAWAIGLPDGYIMMEYQAPVIQGTAEDVARGVVEVRGGSRLIITTRSPAGYAVDFYPNGRLFQAVQIEGIGNPVELGATGGTVVQQQAAARRGWAGLKLFAEQRRRSLQACIHASRAVGDLATDCFLT